MVALTKRTTRVVLGLLAVVATTAVAARDLSGRRTTAHPASVASEGRLRATSPMREARAAHSATALPGGNVLIVGGYRGRGAAIIISRTAEIFDAGSGRFQKIPGMTVRRHKHDAVAVGQGRVLITGGADERDDQGVYSSVESFDAADGRFRLEQPMRLSRYKHRGTAILLSGSLVLLAGGAAQAEEYDPVSGRSVVVDGDARVAGQFSAAAALPDGRVLIGGGYGQGRGPRANAWIYELSSDARNSTGR